MISELKLFHGEYRNFEAPVCVFFDVTNKCNLNCFYCFSNDNNMRKTKAAKGLTTEQIKEILDDMAVSGVKVVEFSGGEPLVDKDILDIIRYAKKLNLEVSFVSNGTLFTDEICQELKPLVKHVNITLRGCDEQTHDKVTGVAGSYKRTIENIKRLNRFDIGVGVLLDPTYLNYNKIYDYISGLIKKEQIQLKSIFMNRINIRNVANQGDAKEQYCLQTIQEYEHVFEQLDRIYKEYNVFIEIEAFPICQVKQKYHKYITRCNYGLSNASIDYEGNLKMCPVSNKVVGNLLEHGIKELWNNSDVTRKFRNLSWLNEKCSKCQDFEKCGGGCYTSKPETMTYQDDYFNKDKIFGDADILKMEESVIVKDMGTYGMFFYTRVVPRLLPVKKYHAEPDVLEISGDEYSIMKEIDSHKSVKQIRDKLGYKDEIQFDNMLIALKNRGIIS